jgi:thiamine biosynthesis lipoprotein
LAGLVIDDTARVCFDRPMQLDLGGIAKGYAVDCAVDALRSAGVSSGSVNAGGDLRVFGAAATRVHVRDPRRPHACMPLADVRDAAVATSATYFSRRRVRGAAVSAIVDPLRCEPCRTRASASVIASCCAVADALTKVVLLDERRAAHVLRRFAASAVVITPRGRVRTVESHAA